MEGNDVFNKSFSRRRSVARLFVICVVSCFFLVACNKQSSPPSPPVAPPPVTVTPAEATEQPAEVAEVTETPAEVAATPAEVTETPTGGFGTVKGQIKYVGATVPEARTVLISKDPEVCGKGQREIVEVSVENGLLDESVVYLDGDYPDAVWKEPEGGKYLLMQEKCRFVPYIQVVRKNAELRITTKDPILHNIHSYEIIGRGRRDLFNFSQPKMDDRTTVVKPRRSNFVQLTCDAHDFMAGWMFAADNPYAMVAKGGTFELKVPAGTHDLKVWHPILGSQEVEGFEIKEGEQKTVDFTFE